MEFYGSIDSVSGSITASLFTGSFKGDGGGLYNLAASGVTGLNLSQIASGNATASISSTGFTVNKNTQIQGDLSVTGSIIATNYIVSSSVTYMTTSFASGSSMFGNDGNDVHQFTGSVQITGSISLNGQAIGTGKLDETTFQSYTSSISSSIGSLSSSIALTDVSQSNRLTTIEGNYATTGSNLFKGSQTISGSIIPSVDNLYDLGSSTHQWRDVYISSGSLYIDGTKVLGSTSQELTITTDTGQSIKILEAGSDSIILQSADGDIELKSSGGGDILFDPTNGII
jgi:filamentous hemagglutinin